MTTQANPITKTTPPTLLARNDEGSDTIIPLFDAVMSMDRKLDAMQVLEKSAEQSGMEFLFEIPGALFELPGHRVAVLNASTGSEKHDHVFVLYAMNEGIINVLNYDEIPDQAKRFFHSYVSVLSCLSDMPAVRNLH
ncbi:MAG: hypothetical protein AAGA76_08235 [Pseudomonadota bacterium]